MSTPEAENEIVPTTKMQFPWKKWSATYVIALLVALYTVFIAEHFWNWFGTPILHIPAISFVQTCCIMCLLGLFTRNGFPVNLKGELGSMKAIDAAISFCIPKERQQEWNDYLNDDARVLFESISAVLGAVGVNTALLAVGFLLHLAIRS